MLRCRLLLQNDFSVVELGELGAYDPSFLPSTRYKNCAMPYRMKFLNHLGANLTSLDTIDLGFAQVIRTEVTESARVHRLQRPGRNEEYLLDNLRRLRRNRYSTELRNYLHRICMLFHSFMAGKLSRTIWHRLISGLRLHCN